METKKLYQQNVYLQQCESTILKLQDENLVVLDQTVFFPVGGGQGCDLGTIDQVDVQEVFEKDGVVFHRIADTSRFSEGQTVSCRIDWNRRFDHMQRHCGEHILSGMFFREYGGVNRGFHMGEEYMTVDISLEEKPEFTEITWDMAQHVEVCTNEAIWSNAPVTVLRFESRKDAEKMPLRKKLALDEDISIVCVGDINNASDCVACCGTHPSTAGQVGLVKIYKVEHYKGMFRIYFEAGKRALQDYDRKHDLITTLGNRYSAGAHDLLNKIKTQDEKNKEVRQELYVLKQSVIAQRIESLRPQVSSGEIVIAAFDDLKVNDLMSIGRPLIPEIKKLLFLVSSTENTLLLFSDGTVDCGKLVKENASIYRGKGGGNASSARAMFPKTDDLETFMDLIEKHLR